MDRTIAADLFRYEGRTGFKGLLRGLITPGFRYMFVVRKIAKTSKYSPMWLIYRLILRRYSFKFGFQIPHTTQIGEGFYIGHFGALVVSPNAKIGKNCNVAHGVTIGMANRGRLRGAPTIGDKVWIGTGAVIVGKITIGDNVLIAPNSYVNVDVPPFSLVLGNPCKIVPKDDPIDRYIEFILP
jgi:serine O-acetyltransferase